MMTVPKTSVHEQSTVARSKNYVRLSRQVYRMKAITVAKAEQKLAYCNLCRGIFHANGTHQRCSLRSGQAIHQMMLLPRRKNYDR